MNTKLWTYKLREVGKDLIVSLKWIIFSLVIGGITGICCTFFRLALTFSEIIRSQNSWLIYLLPIGGLATIALYHVFKDPDDIESNLVISTIRANCRWPFRTAPLLFISTVITHLLGGSAGGEGSAMQIGGSIANEISRALHFNEKDTRAMILCGMSAGLSALLGTPMTAAVLSLEILTVGTMEYSAFLPCVLGSYAGSYVARFFGITGTSLKIASIPSVRIKTCAAVSVLAILAGCLAIIFSLILFYTERFYKYHLKNHYLRILTGGCLTAACTLLIGSQYYCGSGMNIIEDCLAGDSSPAVFLFKMVLTALTIGAGFKGGEIVPSLAVGAAFGYLFGSLIGFNPGFCAAVGMIALFCGITNSPVASLLLAFEFFDYKAMPFFLLAVAFSYTLSGYFGKYLSRKSVYTRYKASYLSKFTDADTSASDELSTGLK